MYESDEWPKAGAEAAKLGTTLVGAVEKAGGYFAKHLDEPLTQLSGITTDELKSIRQQLQLKHKTRELDKIIEILDQRGIKVTRSISKRLLIPMLEQATLEEEDELKDIWCKLIANSLDPAFDVKIRYAFIDILKSLTSLDAKILKYIYDTIMITITQEQINIAEVNLNEYTISIDKIIKDIPASDSEIKLSLYNLKRVQCVWDGDFLDRKSGILPGKRIIVRENRDKNYTLTLLGSALIEACMK